MYTVNSRQVVPDLHVISGCVVFPEDDQQHLAWHEDGQAVHSPFNAYLLSGDRTLLYDTLPPNMVSEVTDEVSTVLDGRSLDYVMVSHPESPHGGNAPALLSAYPDAELLLPSAGSMHDLHVGADASAFRRVSHGEELDLGSHRVTFHDPLLFDLAATVWMYEETTGTLFTSDGYGWSHLERECGRLAGECFDRPEDALGRWDNFHTTAIPWIEYYDPEKYEVLAAELIDRFDPDVLAPAHGAPATEGATEYLRLLRETIVELNEGAGEDEGDAKWLL